MLDPVLSIRPEEIMIPPSNIDALVIDHLLFSGQLDAAVLAIQDQKDMGGSDPVAVFLDAEDPAELYLLTRERSAIRTEIEAGEIQKALDLINELDWTLLLQHPALL